jgi:glycosyltransferase involved in cell wall biosynthesis
MRIALFTDTYSPQVNGVARTLARLAGHLSERGHAVALITPADTRSDASDAFSTLHMRLPGIRLPFYPELRLVRPLNASESSRLRAFAPHIVHVATEFTLGWSGVQWAQQHDVPLVSSFHTDFAAYLTAYGGPGLEAVAWRFLRGFHARARVTFCPSQSTLQQLRTHGFAGDLRIWTRGVDADRFNPEHASHALRRQLASDARPLILCVSRVAPEKRLELLLAAHQQLRADFPAAALVVVGSGPALPRLREQAGPGVHFAGSLAGAELAAAYASADLFAFPSDTETFGNVVLEAAASGLPLIAADRGGVTDTVIHGWTGLCFSAGNANSLADCMRRLLQDEQLRRTLARNARAHALTRRWDHILDGVSETYREVVVERTARVA